MTNDPFAPKGDKSLRSAAYHVIEQTVAGTRKGGALPQIPDGFCLSQQGALEAIDEAARAFLIEMDEFKKCPTSKEATAIFEQCASACKSLLSGLSSLPVASKHRLLSMPSEQFWRRINIHNQKQIQDITQSSTNDVGLTEIDSDFIKSRAINIIIPTNSIEIVESDFYRSIESLHKVVSLASRAFVEKNKEDTKAYEEAWPHPIFMLIRECDAILFASSPEVISKTGKKTLKYSKHLSKFATKVYCYATGTPETTTAVENYIKEYSDSFNTVVSEHPDHFREYRIIRLRYNDFIKHYTNIEECPNFINYIKRKVYEFSNSASKRIDQHSGTKDYHIEKLHQRLDEIENIESKEKKQIQTNTGKLKDKLNSFINSHKHLNYHLASYHLKLADIFPESGQNPREIENNLAKSKKTSSTPILEGKTILSNPFHEKDITQSVRDLTFTVEAVKSELKQIAAVMRQHSNH